ncbi:hypothetical protein ABZ667_43570, partial [Streptomyces lavendulae]|uniref:hypothetical protein n=1 Tax=Streptomyces lavendulae TaxID=1914 RepID=UPI0034820146
MARVAAIDIAKAPGMVCLRVPHDAIEGRRVQQVWNVASTTNAILELGDRLVCQGVERVVMEATGNYLGGAPVTVVGDHHLGPRRADSVTPTIPRPDP